jgi:integrase
LAAQTGLRVSELTHLTCRDVHLGAGAHVRCEGKGRKERCTPLTGASVAVLRDWLAERGGAPHDALSPPVRAAGYPPTLSKPGSPSTALPPPETIRRWPARSPHRTRSATAWLWTSCTAASTPPSSACG